MSGTFATINANSASGNALIDGILAAGSWADATVFYNMPQIATEYRTDYGGGEYGGFFPTTDAMGIIIDFALNADVGSSADDGFSIEGFTNLSITFTESADAHIRLAQTSSDPYSTATAWGYYPATTVTAGDIWFANVVEDYSTPVAGGYAALTIMHEIGHAMGLEHAQDSGTFGAVPSSFDAMEYTVMSYRSYVGASVTAGYLNETFGYAQTFMMLDIQALQYMYGADFTTNSGDTIYSWDPGSGNTLVNGAVAISPGANRIFATIWDGGGVDTYDLSAYSGDLMVDLTPGGFSLFGSAQQADLGNSHNAQGNIYNALQYQGDVRSLIENAIGGSGDDLLRGNQADNDLRGNGGHDKLLGVSGKDFLKGAGGKDYLKGGGGKDVIKGGAKDDTLLGDGGRDRLYGGGGNDIMTGGSGRDKMTGGTGSDTFRYIKASDSETGTGSDLIKDFDTDVDKIDLAALAATPFTFTSNSFSGTGPSVMTTQNESDLNVLIDLDGDAIADMQIILDGIDSVTASDFIL